MNKDKKKKIIMTEAFCLLRGSNPNPNPGKSNDFLLEQEKNFRKF